MNVLCLTVSSLGDEVSFRTKAMPLVYDSHPIQYMDFNWDLLSFPKVPTWPTAAIASMEILISRPWFWRNFVTEAINLCISNLFSFVFPAWVPVLL